VSRPPDDDQAPPCPVGEPYAAVAETHTGVVIFVGDRAYKLKKPVSFPFLDVRTVAARRACCEQEVRLNRRLAPDVYLGVGAIVEPGCEAREPIVVMRRLPAARRLSQLVRSGADVHDVLRRVAHQLATLHAGTPPATAHVEAAGVDALRRRWRGNAAELAALTVRSSTIAENEEVLGAAESYLAGRRRLFEQRITDGWCRDGHGDLLADDIFCLDDGPRLLDCLEFDDSLRIGDVLADAAFLAMDLERLGRPDLGWWFLAQHRDLLGDRWPVSLAHHHVAYRAQVRAKVACARAAQGAPDAEDDAARLLGIAARHLDAGRVRLVVIGGLPGTGKSTLAAVVAGDLDAVVVRSDEVRKRLAGLPAAAHAAAAVDQGIYDPASIAGTYAEMIREARLLLEGGHSVVLDASFSGEEPRRAAGDLAAAATAQVTMLQCVAPFDVSGRRLAERAAVGADPSDADAAVAAAMASRFAPWREATEIDTAGGLGPTITAVRAALGRSG
jgi:aminoglycoside phosphotransferase family enzyme/predicted kinase